MLIELDAMRAKNRFPGLTLWLGLTLTGCTSAAVTVDQSTNPNPFPLERAEEVFITGFDSIASKYIDEVNLDTVALEGLRGLAALDPGLSIVSNEGYLTARLNGVDFIAMPEPKSRDVEGWAHLVTIITLEASRNSDDIRQAHIERVYESIFDGALSTLDIYSRYAGAEEAGSNRAKRGGYVGIGIHFLVRDGKPTVTQVLDNSPSAELGIQVGDQITHVNGLDTTNQSAKEIRDSLRGPANTTVKVTVMRSDEEEVTHTVERKLIIQPTVRAELNDDILYVKVKSFNQGTVSSFSSDIARFVESENPPKGIVLDLRGNPGGLLKQSIELADTLLITGDILNTSGRHPDSVQHYEAVAGDITSGLPLVVLIDGRSASASEIVAAALQDQSRAVVLGTGSYGKGTVQTVVRLPNDGEITLTWSRFMAPSGYALHGLGVFPVICTSGLDTESGFDQASLESALRTVENRADVFDDWRKTPLTARETRSHLRAICPPERHTDGVDINAAQVLINSATLYKKALALSSRHQIASE